MKTIDSEIKLHNKPFDEMQLPELLAEKKARKWHRLKMLAAQDGIKRKKHWLEENKPIYSKEELTKQYEDGQLTFKQYKTSFATRKRAIEYRMRCDDYIAYADRIIFAEDSVLAYLEELIAERKAEAERRTPKKRARQSYCKYDPRKKISKYNQPLDPRRRWATKKPEKKMPKLNSANARWKRGKANDVKPMKVFERMQPITTWDMDKLMYIARDRGYYTDMAVVAVISETFHVTLGAVKRMLESGKLTWGQCIVIGSIFEMTPKEFCDCFLAGYFREVSDGVYRAHVDDTEALLDAPSGHRRVVVETKEEVEESGD